MYLNRRVFVMRLQIKYSRLYMCVLKASDSLKKYIFIQERVNKLIYGFNTIINCGILQIVKFLLASCF